MNQNSGNMSNCACPAAEGMLPIIMAGGMGTRLRPITETTPKPLVPVDGIPAVCRILDALAQGGWKRAVLTVCYHGEKIRALLGTEYRGIRLNYTEESPDKPLGTAGSVRSAWDTFAKETDAGALILSGDAVFSADLCAFASMHRNKGADASILCVRVPDPSAYGVVLTDPSGRITGFSEKPSVAEAISDTVNTGIYLLSARFIERIPPHTVQDFGHDIFGAALCDGCFLQMYLSDGYWCDIGSFDAYLNCCLDMASGRIAGFPPARVMLPPHISDSAVGQNCFLPSTASVRQSVLFDRVHLGAGASVTGSILCADVFVGDNAVIEAGCVIGEGAVIGQNVRLPCGTKIDAGMTVTAQTQKESDSQTNRSVSDKPLSNSSPIGKTAEASVGAPHASAFDRGISTAPYLTDIGYALCRPGSQAPEPPICAAVAHALTAAAKKEHAALFLACDSDSPVLLSALHKMRDGICRYRDAETEIIFCEGVLPPQAGRIPSNPRIPLNPQMPQPPIPVRNAGGPLLRILITMYEDRPTAALYDTLGLYPDRDTERGLDTLFSDALYEQHRDKDRALDDSSMHPIKTISAKMLCASYVRRFASPLTALSAPAESSVMRQNPRTPFLFRCGSNPAERLLAALLEASGAVEAPDAALLFRMNHKSGLPGANALSPGMLTVYETDRLTYRFSHWDILSLLLHAKTDNPNTENPLSDFPTPRADFQDETRVLSLPYDAPASIPAPMRYSHCPSLSKQNPLSDAARARRMASMEAEDGVLLALRLAQLLSGTQKPLHLLFSDMAARHKTGSLTRRYAAAPAGALASSAATATLRRMTEEAGEDGQAFVPAVEGILFRRRDGASVRVVATRGRNFRIIADAYSAEAAESLCAFARERLLCAAVSKDISAYR